MTCLACAWPHFGQYTLGCRECGLRRISRGLPFWQSMQHGAPTKAYIAQCRALGQPSKVHAEVQAVAERLGKTPHTLQGSNNDKGRDAAEQGRTI